MRRLLIGSCLLALAVIAARAEDKKPVGETFKAMFKELVGKYNTSTPADRPKLIAGYAEKFVDLAKENPKDPGSVDVLVQVMGLPMLPDTKDGPKAKATALLKQTIDQGTDKKLRGKALTAYLGAQENVLLGKDKKASAAAKEEMATYRKLIQTELKGEVKDLFIGARLPELKSKDLDDKEVKLSDLKGKVVVLDIWATWCPPCRAMIPHSRKLVEKLKDKPFVLVSVSADAKKDTLTGFMKDNPMPWTHWWNGQRGCILADLDVKFFPTIFVLDGEGVIRYKNVRDAQMDSAVETLLKEMDKTKGGKAD